ncbi:MAG: ABC transporter permease [Ignavibacteriales bacterium]|nr:ABC transporter permease [Ignavibacteriales bacterium]
MKTLLHLVRKEFIQFRGDKKMFGISFVAPVFQLLVLGYAANLDVANVPLAVCDLDHTSESRRLVDQFTSSGYFSLVANADRADELDHLIDDGHASVAVVIPRDFARKLGLGEPAPLQLLADGSETTTGGIGMSYVSLIALRFSQNILLQSLERRGMHSLPATVSAEIRVWYNPELKSRNFMVPGVLGLLLMVMTLLLTSLAIVKEKEMGTLEQLVVTPIRPMQLMIGKLLPFFLIGIIDVLLVVLVATVVFALPLKGSFALLLLFCLTFLLTTLGLGLFVSTISQTQQQAMMTAIFFIMMPMIFFSGFVFPIENMPLSLQWASYLMPLRYFFVVVRGLFLRGVGFDILWPQGLALLVFGLAIMTMSVLRFRKRIS